MSSPDDRLPEAMTIARGRLRDMPQVASWMSPVEQEHLSSLKFAARRRSWALGRWTAKRAVMQSRGGVDATDPVLWSILPAEDGSPQVFLEHVLQPECISLSHRAGVALAAAVGPPYVVGCDLERIEPRSEAFVEDYLVPSEQTFVRAAVGRERDLRANLIWCGKEAVLKILHTGLRRDTRTVVVRIAPFDAPLEETESAWRSFRVEDRPDGRSYAAWWRVDAGFVEVVALGDGRDQ